MSLVFDLGDTRFIGNHSSATGSTAFKNSAGVDTDPTEVELRLKLPEDTTEVYRWPTPAVGELVLSREITGRFFAVKTFDQWGDYAWKLKGTGLIAEATQGEFYVRRDKA